VFKYRDGKMTWANDRIEEMLGYTKEELVSNDVNLFVAEDVSLTDVTKDVDAGIKSQGHFHGAIRAKKKDGSSAIVEYTASMVPGKEPPEIVGIARDITERRRAEEERERLTAELAEKNREQEQIIYVTSHDLRSPLVNVQGFSRELNYSLQEMTEILENQAVPAEIREQLTSILQTDVGGSLQYIETSIAKMDSLLSGLLRLSRMGRAALNFQTLDMNELLLDIQKAFEYRIQEGGVTVTVGELPSCQGDEVQINQVLSNLMDNALKYLDPERPGTISVTGEERDGRAVYCVEDNGIGIALEHQPKVFEIFHRLNPGETPGEGLGLSIIKKILSRHNGEIWVESESGVGSKFYVYLPAAS
jgi:PAS domain S-box-containing protein